MADETQNPPAVKIAWAIGRTGGYDQRGGEPHDPHGTLKNPVDGKGLEWDPAPPEVIELGRQAHDILTRLYEAAGMPPGTGFFPFLMDGDGRR